MQTHKSGQHRSNPWGDLPIWTGVALFSLAAFVSVTALQVWRLWATA